MSERINDPELDEIMRRSFGDDVLASSAGRHFRTWLAEQRRARTPEQVRQTLQRAAPTLRATPDYIESIMRLDEREFRQLVMGDWDAIEPPDERAQLQGVDRLRVENEYLREENKRLRREVHRLEDAAGYSTSDAPALGGHRAEEGT